MRWIVQAVVVRNTPDGWLVRQLPTFELPPCLGLYKHSTALEAARRILAPFPREGEEVSITVTSVGGTSVTIAVEV